MTLITIISAFVFLIVLWVVVGVRHLKNSKKTLDGAWEFVDDRIRKRHDYAPVLVECVRVNGADSSFAGLIDKMISVRDTARRIYFPCADKLEKEKSFENILSEIVAYGEKTDALKNTYFLEVKKEIIDVNADIAGRARNYNEVVLKYNESLKNFFLKPLAFILKARDAENFNF